MSSVRSSFGTVAAAQFARCQLPRSTPEYAVAWAQATFHRVRGRRTSASPGELPEERASSREGSPQSPPVRQARRRAARSSAQSWLGGRLSMDLRWWASSRDVPPCLPSPSSGFAHRARLDDGRQGMLSRALHRSLSHCGMARLGHATLRRDGRLCSECGHCRSNRRQLLLAVCQTTPFATPSVRSAKRGLPAHVSSSMPPDPGFRHRALGSGVSAESMSASPAQSTSARRTPSAAMRSPCPDAALRRPATPRPRCRD